MSGYVVLMTTVSQSADAQRLSRQLVEQRLAACVQALPITSCYTWDGDVCTEPETLLLIKTRAALQQAVAEALTLAHPYEVPELIAAPVSFGLPAYLNWIDAQTAKPAEV